MGTARKDGDANSDHEAQDSHEHVSESDYMSDELIKNTPRIRDTLDIRTNYAFSDLSLPYAEENWAHKEEAQELAEGLMRRLQAALKAAGRDINRCKSGLDCIVTDSGQIQCKRVRTWYSRSEVLAQERLIKVVDQRQKLIEAIALLRPVLEKARAKKYPGKGKPRENLSPVVPGNGADWGPRSTINTPSVAPTATPGRPGGTTHSDTPSGSTRPDRELNDLLNMGPIGGASRGNGTSPPASFP